MKALFDTSSLLALIRYYMPFDDISDLKQAIQKKFENGEIILLDKVIDESKFVARGIILQELNFINTAKAPIVKTADMVPNKKFYNLLENGFCNKNIVRMKGIDEVEFGHEINKFIETADARLLLYALSIKNNSPVIVTEESHSSNDNKIFKKIPENCKVSDIACFTLPQYLKNHVGISMSVEA